MLNNKSEQYYPTYKAADRDVLLIEFEEAQKIANGQIKAYGQMANILLAIVIAIIPLFLNSTKSDSKNIINDIQTNSILFSFIIYLFAAFLLRYFVDLQKQITINARKVATLRTMLGLDYGRIHLTLPNWRVEGATNPFVIKYFYGWFRFRCSPFWILIIGVNVIWYLATKDKLELHIQISHYEMTISKLWGYVLIIITYAYIFRTNLNDRHETNYLHFIKVLAFILGLKLVKEFEYILYKAKLSFIELDRLKVNYENLKKILIDIEDKSFSHNKGYSWKSIVRGALSRFKRMRVKYKYIQSGGSTITMQLVRTLFIPANQNKYSRKVIEILLSIWINNQFSKDELLKLYISSVRYERGVIGLSNAIKYFFGEIKAKILSNEESFFLVERLSNITSTINWERINHLKNRTPIILDADVLENIYQNQLRENRLKS